MNNNGQEKVDLREPVACWQKVLFSIISVLLLVFLIVGCCNSAKNGADALVGTLPVMAVFSLPFLLLAVKTLNFWWGKKYLVINGKTVVIYLELLCFKRTRSVITGPNSRLQMLRKTIRDPQESGAGAEKLELYITDTYGHRHLLLQFSESEKERTLAIFHEICRQLPALKPEQEG